MPEVENEVNRDEEYLVEEEEEGKKFPVWIVPLVAGPVLLIVLIVALAGSQPTTVDGKPPPEPFNEPKLKEAADKLVGEASKFYYDASQVMDQREKDKILDKAGEACDKAIMNIDKIREYYEEHDIQHTVGGIWDWEQTAEEAYKLRAYITRDRGLTGYDD